MRFYASSAELDDRGCAPISRALGNISRVNRETSPEPRDEAGGNTRQSLGMRMTRLMNGR